MAIIAFAVSHPYRLQTTRIHRLLPIIENCNGSGCDYENALEYIRMDVDRGAELAFNSDEKAGTITLTSVVTPWLSGKMWVVDFETDAPGSRAVKRMWVHESQAFL